MDFFAAIVAFNFLELIADFNLVVKIFALMSIISFVKNHLGTGPVAIVVMVGMSWFILFDYWKFFGGIFILYSLLLAGISGVIIDFFFVGGMGGGSEPQQGMLSPVSSGADLQKRMKAIEAARRSRAISYAMRRMGGG